MAIVFVAFQRTLRRQIAVKILPRSVITADAANLFQQEAEATAILQHPNIIPVYEVGETPDFLFLCMQLVQGNALSRYIQATRKQILPSRRILPLKTTLRIILEVLDALGYAHIQEIVHRDIKPDNILIEKRSNRPLISDFGVAKLLRGDSSKGSMVLGTPLYMAPEQITLIKVDGRADIYGVGTMLFNMLVPTLPLCSFNSQTDLLKIKATNKNGIFLKKPSELNPHLNADMDRIVDTAMAFNPADRYANCDAFITDLKRYQQKYLS